MASKLLRQAYRNKARFAKDSEKFWERSNLEKFEKIVVPITIVNELTQEREVMAKRLVDGLNNNTITLTINGESRKNKRFSYVINKSEQAKFEALSSRRHDYFMIFVSGRCNQEVVCAEIMFYLRISEPKHILVVFCDHDKDYNDIKNDFIQLAKRHYVNDAGITFFSGGGNHLSVKNI